MVQGCDAHSVLSCVSVLRVCTCTSLITSGGRRRAITDLLWFTVSFVADRSCFPASHTEYVGLYSAVCL